jgi:hypothetical protein
LSKRAAAAASPAPPALPVLSEAEAAEFATALRKLLPTLMRLFIAKGVRYEQLDALIQHAYVEAAQRWFAGDATKPNASQLYMLTGIHRKKIGPLLEEAGQPPVLRPPLPAQVLDHLSSNTALMDGRGNIKPLPYSRREGGEASFEAVVERFSKDVRPRAVLDQMIASGLLMLDDAGTIHAVTAPPTGGFAPGTEIVGMDRALRPVAEAVVAGVLHTGVRSSTLSIVIQGLRQEVADEMVQGMRKKLRALLLAFNDEAEQRAAKERRARRGGDRTLYSGSFDWIEGWEVGEVAAAQLPDAQTAPAAPSPTAAKTAKPRVRRKP